MSDVLWFTLCWYLLLRLSLDTYRLGRYGALVWAGEWA